MKRFIPFSFFVILANLFYSQDAQDNENHYKYWYYRYRLVNYFLQAGQMMEKVFRPG